MRRLNQDELKAVIGIMIVWCTWVTMAIYSTGAKADRVIAVEEKVDYIYKYLIEKNK